MAASLGGAAAPASGAATSGWSSWATACWAWSSPTCCSSASPTDAEGALTQRLVALVRRESLAEVATGLDLGRWLRTWRPARPSSGGASPAILADCCEAADRRHLPRRRLRGRADVRRRATGRRWSRPCRRRRATPRWRCRNGRRRAASQLPVYRRGRRPGPAHAATFTVEVSARRAAAADRGGCDQAVGRAGRRRRCMLRTDRRR